MLQTLCVLFKSRKILGRLYLCKITKEKSNNAENIEVKRNTKNSPNSSDANIGRKLNTTIIS